jgi:hypothetical protein
MTMAELKLTALQQRFFLAVVEGKPPAEAFKAARLPGFDKTRHQQITELVAKRRGNELMKHPALQHALARARATMVERIQLRVEDLVEQLMETRQVAFACDPPQLSAAVAATMGAAKLLGLAIDRSEINVIHNKPSLLPTTQLELSVEEWRRQFDPSPELKRVAAPGQSRDRSRDEIEHDD